MTTYRKGTRPTVTRAGRRAGFSLIEILAAMAILMMIVVIMGRIFRDANRSWTMGTSRVLNNTTGRATVDMIAQDLQYAVADELLTFYAGPERKEDEEIDKPYDSVKWHEINFVSLQNNRRQDSEGKPLRTAVEVSYYVKQDPNNEHRYAILRRTATSAIVQNPQSHSYGDPMWHDKFRANSGHAYLAENIACLQFYCASTNGIAGLSEFDSRDHGDMLPMYVDIYLEVLDDRAAKQLADMAALQERGVAPNPPGGSMEMFMEQNVKRYTKRVFFRNRDGYKPGR